LSRVEMKATVKNTQVSCWIITFSTHNGLKQGEALPSLLLPVIVWRWQYNTPGDGKACS